MTDYYFEDFKAGQKFTTASRTIDEGEIIAFGRRYAAQPYHTDPEAAKQTPFGGLVAPGYMTCAITFGLFADTGVLRAAGNGSPGADYLRWHKPVRPGDTLHVIAEIKEVSPAKPEGGRDAIRIEYTTWNQKNEKVLTLLSLHFVRRRDS